MLVLTRKQGEELVINGTIRVRVIKIVGGTCHIGIAAPDELIVQRKEDPTVKFIGQWGGTFSPREEIIPQEETKGGE